MGIKNVGAKNLLPNDFKLDTFLPSFINTLPGTLTSPKQTVSLTHSAFSIRHSNGESCMARIMNVPKTRGLYMITGRNLLDRPRITEILLTPSFIVKVNYRT